MTPSLRHCLDVPWFRVAIVMAALSVATGAVADEPAAGEAADAPCVELQVLPGTIRLGGMNRQQQLLVRGRMSGTLADPWIDVTHRCRIEPVDAAVVRVDHAAARGLREGRTELVVRYGALVQRVGVEVTGAASYPPVHFANDLVPILAKLGCNGGGCHGKQSGQNGFKLSVFGFDPDADYAAIVHEGRGRRVFPADPDHSLLLRKATGRVPHGGGVRTDTDSLDSELLREWIRQGMPRGETQAPTVQSLRIEPSEATGRVRGEQQLMATAIFSDGTTRDVTSAASYASNADAIAAVDRSGRVRIGQVSGEAAISANYLGHVATARLIVPRTGNRSEFKLSSKHPIDALVVDRLQKLGVTPSQRCDDATFLRRVYVQVLGVLPTADEVRQFLGDASSDKRRQLVDRVLRRDEYADLWALKWADILLVNQEKLGARGAFELHHWLRQQFAANRPYDAWARELLVASGNSAKQGPVNFFRAVRTPEDAAKAVSQAFLGVRIDCAQCHHHPFEKWGQTDFYGMAGFFTGLQRQELSPGREFVFQSGLQPAKHPRTGQEVAVRPPGGDPLVAEQWRDRDSRAALADWMTRPDNPYFARLVANRLWKHFLGRGLVEPEDDLRSTNPATNEPLLAYLEQQVVAQRYDLKAVMHLILTSETYQLSADPNEMNADDQQNYSHFIVTRLPAEVLLDAICQVTESPESFPGLPRGTRAVQAWDNRLPSYFLETFGRSERASPCECGKSGEPTMAQALHLMNAPEIEAKITDPAGRVARLVEAGADRDDIVNQMCLAALGRPPNEKELGIARRLFDSLPPRAAAEDLLWTLLNSYDFLFLQ